MNQMEAREYLKMMHLFTDSSKSFLWEVLAWNILTALEAGLIGERDLKKKSYSKEDLRNFCPRHERQKMVPVVDGLLKGINELSEEETKKAKDVLGRVERVFKPELSPEEYEDVRFFFIVILALKSEKIKVARSILRQQYYRLAGLMASHRVDYHVLAKYFPPVQFFALTDTIHRQAPLST